MKLSELLAIVGDDKIEYQNLNSDLKSANIFKSGAVITFYTSPEKVMDLMNTKRSYTGLIVWIPNNLMIFGDVGDA